METGVLQQATHAISSLKGTIMNTSIMAKIRAWMGQRLLQNTAGYTVLRSSGKSGPWISEGEALALVPSGVQEVQFPVSVLGSDNIQAVAQVSVIFTYDASAGDVFNFAYDATESRHTGDYATATKKVLMSALSPEVTRANALKDVAEMVKQTGLTIEHMASVCRGITITSIQLAISPKDASVLSSLGATKTEELLRSANTARHNTRMQAIEQAAELRIAEHEEALNAEDEAAKLIEEQAKNALARAESSAAVSEKLAEQRASETSAMIHAFNDDAGAFALHELAKSGGDITITTELLAAMRRAQ